MNNSSNASKNITQNVVFTFVLLVVAFAITNFDTFAFAEELTVSKSELSLGGQHDGTMSVIRTSSSDGTIVVFLTTTEPIKGERMSIMTKFADKDGNFIQNINYDITATQNEQVILSKTMVTQHIGLGAHLTETLPSSDLVNIQIILQGMESYPITISQGKPIDIMVVPEFGTIAMMILSVSIISIIAISTKSKVMIKSFTSS